MNFSAEEPDYRAHPKYVRSRRSLTCFKRDVLVIRWFLDATRVKQLASDNGISKSTAYDPTAVPLLAPPPAWICGGRENTTTMAATSRSSPPRTAGRCGHSTYAQAANTTPTAVRTHAEILPLLAKIRDDLRTLADLGYEGEAGTITVAFKKPKNGKLTDVQRSSTRHTTRYARSGNVVTPCSR